ncbi:unnamed protein product [Notodromas monacha]|uniref:Uncharacterized protein n=1 Tax=Notodromas monacha TaxID=399045 RepID=A0A7R9GA00_9CRUS|nr:unnamed protein product [Notodromas monacha]CAG0913166.1 unnamed protein product [Notodromas monacha]
MLPLCTKAPCCVKCIQQVCPKCGGTTTTTTAVMQPETQMSPMYPMMTHDQMSFGPMVPPVTESLITQPWLRTVIVTVLVQPTTEPVHHADTTDTSTAVPVTTATSSPSTSSTSKDTPSTTSTTMRTATTIYPLFSASSDETSTVATTDNLEDHTNNHHKLFYNHDNNSHYYHHNHNSINSNNYYHNTCVVTSRLSSLMETAINQFFLGQLYAKSMEKNRMFFLLLTLLSMTLTVSSGVIQEKQEYGSVCRTLVKERTLTGIFKPSPEERLSSLISALDNQSTSRKYHSTQGLKNLVLSTRLEPCNNKKAPPSMDTAKRSKLILVTLNGTIDDELDKIASGEDVWILTKGKSRKKPIKNLTESPSSSTCVTTTNSESTTIGPAKNALSPAELASQLHLLNSKRSFFFHNYLEALNDTVTSVPSSNHNPTITPLPTQSDDPLSLMVPDITFDEVATFETNQDIPHNLLSLPKMEYGSSKSLSKRSPRQTSIQNSVDYILKKETIADNALPKRSMRHPNGKSHPYKFHIAKTSKESYSQEHCSGNSQSEESTEQRVPVPIIICYAEHKTHTIPSTKTTPELETSTTTISRTLRPMVTTKVMDQSKEMMKRSGLQTVFILPLKMNEPRNPQKHWRRPLVQHQEHWNIPNHYIVS